MWYTLRYANTFIYTPAHGGRAGHLRDRPPVLVRFYGTPLPDASGQCRGTANHDDCPPPPLHRSDRAPRHSCLPPARPRGAAATIIAAAHHVGDLRHRSLRVPPGPVTPESADLRPAHQPVDTGARRRGQFRPGPDAETRQRRNHSPGPPPVASILEAGQALDYQSRCRVCSKKNGAPS